MLRTGPVACAAVRRRAANFPREASGQCPRRGQPARREACGQFLRTLRGPVAAFAHFRAFKFALYSHLAALPRALERAPVVHTTLLPPVLLFPCFQVTQPWADAQGGGAEIEEKRDGGAEQCAGDKKLMNVDAGSVEDVGVAACRCGHCRAMRPGN
jgi:hypothetical protein